MPINFKWYSKTGERRELKAPAERRVNLVAYKAAMDYCRNGEWDGLEKFYGRYGADGYRAIGRACRIIAFSFGQPWDVKKRADRLMRTTEKFYDIEFGKAEASEF